MIRSLILISYLFLNNCCHCTIFWWEISLYCSFLWSFRRVTETRSWGNCLRTNMKLKWEILSRNDNLNRRGNFGEFHFIIFFWFFFLSNRALMLIFFVVKLFMKRMLIHLLGSYSTVISTYVFYEIHLKSVTQQLLWRHVVVSTGTRILSVHEEKIVIYFLPIFFSWFLKFMQHRFIFFRTDWDVLLRRI